MAICKDSSITFLNKFGYNVIKLPKQGIEPLDLVGRDNTTEWLGKLSSVWKGNLPEPAPGPAQPASDVQGQQSDQLQLSVGLKVLANALSAFGVPTPEVTAAYSQARTVQFTFTSVTSTAVPPLEAGNYLASGDLETNNAIVKHYFTDDNSHAYLIFDVLQTDSMTVTANGKYGEELTLDVPQIQGFLGTKVAVSASSNGSSTLTYKGQFPVAFGFKALDEIKLENGQWALEGAKASSELAFGATAGGNFEPSTSVAETLQPVLLQAGGMVSL